MRSLICLLILLFASYCSDSGTARPDLGNNLQDLSQVAADLALSPPDGGAAADLGSTGAAPICSVDGWCWDSPLPQGNTLSAVWGESASNVWAVGLAGTIVNGDYVSLLPATARAGWERNPA